MKNIILLVVMIVFFKAHAAEEKKIYTETEFKEKLDKLCKLTENVDIQQVEFQKLVGKIEVLGELIIKHS